MMNGEFGYFNLSTSLTRKKGKKREIKSMIAESGDVVLQRGL